VINKKVALNILIYHPEKFHNFLSSQSIFSEFFHFCVEWKMLSGKVKKSISFVGRIRQQDPIHTSALFVPLPCGPRASSGPPVDLGCLCEDPLITGKIPKSLLPRAHRRNPVAAAPVRSSHHLPAAARLLAYAHASDRVVPSLHCTGAHAIAAAVPPRCQD
jgi:hypothetical protein